MRILSLQSEPFHLLGYHNAGPRGRGVEYVELPFVFGEVDALPDGLEALVLASVIRIFLFQVPWPD